MIKAEYKIQIEYQWELPEISPKMVSLPFGPSDNQYQLIILKNSIYLRPVSTEKEFIRKIDFFSIVSNEIEHRSEPLTFSSELNGWGFHDLTFDSVVICYISTWSSTPCNVLQYNIHIEPRMDFGDYYCLVNESRLTLHSSVEKRICCFKVSGADYEKSVSGNMIVNQNENVVFEDVCTGPVKIVIYEMVDDVIKIKSKIDLITNRLRSSTVPDGPVFKNSQTGTPSIVNEIYGPTDVVLNAIDEIEAGFNILNLENPEIPDLSMSLCAADVAYAQMQEIDLDEEGMRVKDELKKLVALLLEKRMQLQGFSHTIQNPPVVVLPKDDRIDKILSIVADDYEVWAPPTLKKKSIVKSSNLLWKIIWALLIYSSSQIYCRRLVDNPVCHVLPHIENFKDKAHYGLEFILFKGVPNAYKKIRKLRKYAGIETITDQISENLMELIDRAKEINSNLPIQESVPKTVSEMNTIETVSLLTTSSAQYPKSTVEAQHDKRNIIEITNSTVNISVVSTSADHPLETATISSQGKPDDELFQAVPKGSDEIRISVESVISSGNTKEKKNNQKADINESAENNSILTNPADLKLDTASVLSGKLDDKIIPAVRENAYKIENSKFSGENIEKMTKYDDSRVTKPVETNPEIVASKNQLNFDKVDDQLISEIPMNNEKIVSSEIPIISGEITDGIVNNGDSTVDVGTVTEMFTSEGEQEYGEIENSHADDSPTESNEDINSNEVYSTDSEYPEIIPLDHLAENIPPTFQHSLSNEEEEQAEQEFRLENVKVDLPIDQTTKSEIKATETVERADIFFEGEQSNYLQEGIRYGQIREE